MGMMFLTRKRNKRSNINLSHSAVTPLAPGNLIPISFTRIVTGDRLSFSPSSFVQAFPMSAPLVNGFKIKFEYFFAPDRLYNLDMMLDTPGYTENPHQCPYPSVSAPPIPVGASGTRPFDFGLTNSKVSSSKNLLAVVQPGSLAEYCGFPAGLFPTYLASGNRNRFSGLKMLQYLDVVLNYYANQQVPNLLTASYSQFDQDEPTQGEGSFPLNSLVKFMKAVKTAADPFQAIDIASGVFSDANLRYSETTLGTWAWFTGRNSIFQRCLPPYYLESWLASSSYNDAEYMVDLQGESFMLSSRKVSAMSHIQRWLDLAMAGGGKYSDYNESEFDVSNVKNPSVPLFLGADSHFLGSKVIYQTTGFDNAQSPLGAFAGQAAGGQSFRRRSFKFGENGFFMVMASLVPDTMYHLGMDEFNRELNLGDTYAPALDNIAMEPLQLETVNAIPTVGQLTLNPAGTTDTFRAVLDTDADMQYKSLGFVPAWSKLMQKVSRSYGRMNTELRSWVLSRTYSYSPDFSSTDPTLQSVREQIESNLNAGTLSVDLAERLLAFIETASPGNVYTPYIRSNMYNDNFEDVSDEAQNFVLTASFSMKVNREKGKVNVSNTI